MTLRIFGLAALASALLACGSSSYVPHDPYNLAQHDRPVQAQPIVDTATRYDFEDSDVLGGMVTATSESMSAPSSRRAQRSRSSQPTADSAAPRPAPAQPIAGPAPMAPLEEPMLASNGDEVPDITRDADRPLPLLIYTGGITLAIYDVEQTKVEAVAVIEDLGGYASQRTGHSLVLRVPAERFREALDALGELGDPLSVTWQAQDVGDEFHDLEVRLRNAQQMRARMEQLLNQAETVSDALAIERELERITLEIERIEGQRRLMLDRIAFATITVSFSQLPQEAVPGEEYRLPFQWLNQIGVERLLNL